MSVEAKISPQQIYDAIGLGDKVLTPEQTQAIQAPHGPQASLVVAGAGSGKTELMSVRVLWLVANGFARPEQILGLTFTRKAAGELAQRIKERLQQLSKTDLWPEGLEALAPKIATYNSYANEIFRQYSLLLGVEAEASLLTDATAFQVVKRVLLAHAEEFADDLAEIERGFDRIVELVIETNQQLVDNQVSADQVEAVVSAALEKVLQLPKTGKRIKGDHSGDIQEFRDKVSLTPLLAKLAKLFAERKQQEGLVDYSDQIAFALEVIEKHPELAVEEQRQTYSHVLLDEYQDTSYLQTRLLQQLFHHHSVLAVGDPNQSIYGWRGASASNLATFGSDFGDGFGSEPGQVSQFKLQTSWRNPEIVLDVANAIAGPLAAPPSYLKTSGSGEKLGVAVLQPRTGAGVGSIAIDAFETSYDEANAVADWFAAKFDAAQKAGKKPTGAVLLRSRANMELFRLALESRGVQAEPVGLDGLLQTPEVFDLICALRVIHTPNSGSSLMRLLAGPRWRLGVKDLNALFEYAKSQDSKHYKLHDRGQVYAPEDAASTVDALESLLSEKRVPSGQMSDEGFDRMRDAAALFQNLRRQVGLPLVEFVNLVLQSLWLDIEVEANPNRVVPMANLNAFLEKVNSFTETANHATLGNFLEWLDYLQARERNEVPTVAQKFGVVQLLTVHAAKGLEWQYVAVPEMVIKDPEGLGGWVSAGKLPYPLRGDANSLPQLDLEAVHSQEDYGASYKQFREDMREHLEREERRVAYVAVTRPEKELLATISYWKPGAKKSANKPNEYFLAIAETLCSNGIISEAKFEALKSGSKYDDVPETMNSEVRNWPLEPLGEKHAIKFRQAASEVSAADAKSLGESSLSKNIDRLLLELQQLEQQAPLVELPVRIPASVFHKYIYEFDTMVKASHRPMPEEPYKQSLTGTEFHGWLERQFGQGIAIDFDALDEPLDEEDETRVDIAALQATFAKSPWANLTPAEVEVEIQVAIDKNIFICKLDAVYKTETGHQIVDWKTGKPPVDQKDEDAKGLQLSLYRMAYARHLGVDPNTITCALYYVTEDKILEPPIKTEAELIELWQGVLAKVRPATPTD